MTAQPSIVITNLSKQYAGSPILALDSLSLTVNEGEIYGFLGPNGAGKSTTIRLLMNFLQPTSGSATILGLDAVNDSVELKKSVGYLSGDVALYPKMRGKQFLEYMAALQPGTKASYINELAKRLHADLDKKLGDLSRGNRQKIALIQAIMHKPSVLILDEPTSGLDPLIQEVFYDILKEASANKASVFVSSHILSEVQKMCDRIGIIRDGKLVSERSIADLTSEAAQNFSITFAGKPPLSELRKLKGVKKLESKESSVSLHFHGSLSPLFKILAKHDVTAVDTEHLDLEEVFLHYYEDKDQAS